MEAIAAVLQHELAEAREAALEIVVTAGMDVPALVAMTQAVLFEVVWESPIKERASAVVALLLVHRHWAGDLTHAVCEEEFDWALTLLEASPRASPRAATTTVAWLEYVQDLVKNISIRAVLGLWITLHPTTVPEGPCS
jgi:hypothetical protein